MKEFAQWVQNFINSPVGTAIVSASLSFVYLLVLFAKTSLGKKLFNRVEAKYDDVLKTAKDYKAEAIKQREQAENKFLELKDEYEKKLSAVVSFFEKVEGTLLDALETIPNEKVRSLAVTYLKEKDAFKEEVYKNIGTFTEFVELKEKAENVDNLLKDQANLLAEQFQALYEEKAHEIDVFLEQVKGELHERPNPHAEEEEI